jgi:hypothetical protein
MTMWWSIYSEAEYKCIIFHDIKTEIRIFLAAEEETHHYYLNILFVARMLYINIY